MDYEQKKKRQFVRVIIAEIGMLISVVAIVVVATLAAMGFFISSEGGIEQSGLMQIHSLPTGATVELDGNVLFSRTNLSRTMPAGDHRLKLSRDGYDSWEKVIKMYSGVLIRLYYPRLFLQNRPVESTISFDTAGFYTTSRSRNYVLYGGEKHWQLIDVRSDELKSVDLDVSEIITGKVDEVRWSKNDDAVLVKTHYDAKTEWVLVNLRNTKDSLNLTRTFGMEFTQLTMIDDSANQLFALENKHLRHINVADGAVSKVLLDDVVDFASHENSLVYVSERKDSEKRVRQIGVYRNGEKNGTKLVDVPEEAKVKIALSNYYGDDYIAFVLDNKLTILYGSIPSYDANRTEITDLKQLLNDETLEVVPEKFTVSPDGEYLVGRTGKKFMVTDLEMGDLYEYEAATAELNWLDASMMYAVKDGQILVWDFDGTNQRNLAESLRDEKDNGQALAYPVMITSNNRWLYYMTAKDDTKVLVREKIRD